MVSLNRLLNALTNPVKIWKFCRLAVLFLLKIAVVMVHKITHIDMLVEVESNGFR
jgi:hypothetical protein